MISITGRVLAQLIVVGLWWEGGIGHPRGLDPSGNSDFIGSLLFAAIPTVPLALVIGALDGTGWAMKTRWRAAVLMRVGAPILLILLSLAWIYPVGLVATMTGDAPAMPTYLGALVGMELALAAELLASVWVRIFVWRRRRKQRRRRRVN